MQQGAEVISWSFLTDDLPFVERFPGGGMGPAVVGTLLITGAAALMAIPLGVLGGIYLNEYGGKNPLARLIRFLAEVMTGVPSIVMGLFIYTLVVLNTKEQTGFAGALALGVPHAARSSSAPPTRCCRSCRASCAKGSYALGSRRARTIRTVVLPNAAAGIVERRAPRGRPRRGRDGAVALHDRHRRIETNTSLFNGPNTALSVQIFHNATSPFPAQQDRAWGAALTLIVIVFVITIARSAGDGVLLPPAGGMTPEDGSMPTRPRPQPLTSST